MEDTISLNSADIELAGVGPEVDSKTLEVSEETKYTIATESQALAVCRSLRDGAEDLIRNQAAITAQINGQPPRSKKSLADLGKNWYPNVNSGFLRNEVDRASSQLAHPILTAEYLIASELPPGFPQGEKKSAVFRDAFTKTVRSWCKWNPWVRQSTREVGTFGVAYQVFFDEQEWKPTFIRQDKGFVPTGTNIMDDIPLFSCDYDYQPHELLEIVKKSIDSGADFWDKEAVAAAINSSGTKSKDAGTLNRRSYEEMVRAASLGESVEKGYRNVQCWHLWSVDPDETVSHHILTADTNEHSNSQGSNEEGPSRVLFTRRFQYEEMEDVVMPWVFNLDDGTLNGCWGVGQILFDTSIEYEKSRCDFLMALRLASKLQTTVSEGKNPSEVALHVYDSHTMLEGGQFAGNNAAISADPQPYLAALGAIQQSARERIGDLVPPITPGGDQPSAKHVQVEDQEQTRRSEQRLFNHLVQFARLTSLIAKKLVENTEDDDAKEFQDFLKENQTARLTEEEIDLLAESAQLKTILDYTEYAKAKRAAFAAAMVQSKNPFWDQRELNRIMGDSALGRAVTESTMLPTEDNMGKDTAERQQQLEINAMIAGMTVKAVASDPHWYHMETLRPVLEGAIMSFLQGSEPKDEQFARTALAHYTMHYVYGINQKLIPGDGNNEKSFIAKANKALSDGQLPPEGLKDQVDPIEQVQQQMQAGSQVGPSGAAVAQTV